MRSQGSRPGRTVRCDGDGRTGEAAPSYFRVPPREEPAGSTCRPESLPRVLVLACPEPPTQLHEDSTPHGPGAQRGLGKSPFPVKPLGSFPAQPPLSPRLCHREDSETPRRSANTYETRVCLTCERCPHHSRDQALGLSRIPSQRIPPGHAPYNEGHSAPSRGRPDFK